MINLNGKTAIITGSGRGIGKAVALRLAALGANVVVNGTAESGSADGTAKEIIAAGGEALVVKCDISKYADAEELIKKTLDKYGSIDILINNAGITKDNLIMRMSESDFDDVIATNLKGAFNCTKAVCRSMMKQRGGAIVNMTSVVGVMGNAGQANYAASKAGMIGLTKSTAKEFASRGITCNAIAPGFTQSDMTDKLPENIRDEYLNAIPLGTFAQPDDIANAVVFLVSDMAKYITGQVLHVDGGLVM